MKHAKDFGVDHDIVHWSGRPSEGWRPFFAGWRNAHKEGEEGGYDLIICQAFGSAFGVQKGGALVKFRHFLKATFERLAMKMVFRIKRKFDVPLAVYDVTDDISIHPLNAAVLEQCSLFFKRELPLDPYHAFESFRGSWFRASCLADRRLASWAQYVEKLRPISLGCASIEPRAKDYPLPRERKFDLFYAADETFRPRREGFDKVIERLRGEGLRVYTPKSRLEVEDYLEKLSQAYATISPPGLGWDCHRLYEAALVGTISFTSAPIIKRLHPFLNGQSCCFYDEEGDVAQQIVDFLADSIKVERMCEKAQTHAENFHLHKNIFNYVAEETVRMLPAKSNVR